MMGIMLLAREAFAAEEQPVSVQFPRIDVRSVLDYYSRLTGRKVWLDLAVHGSVSIQIEKPIPKVDAIELIRTTLLEKHGIEMREPNAKETFVTWSADPKYKDVIEVTKKSPLSLPVTPSDSSRRKVRIVN